MHIHVSRMRATALGGSIQIAATFQGVVRVQLDDGRWLRRDVRANSNFVSTRPPRAHFGLGARRVVAIEITWPDGEVQAVHRDRFDSRVRIERRR